MKKKIFIIALTTILLSVPSTIVNANNLGKLDFTKSNIASNDYKKGEVLVVFKNNTSSNTIKNIVDDSKGDLDEIIKVSDTNKVATIDVPSNTSSQEVMSELEDNSKVLIVQRNYKYHFFENAESKNIVNATTNFLELVSATKAWNLIENGNYTTTRVGVIDTGVDLLHEDLSKNLVSNENYTIFAKGKKIISNDDTGFHGTHVTGIIGADNDSKGMTGVASGNNNDLVEILPIGSSQDGLNFYTSDIVAGINYAKENNVKVINMSLGYEGRDRIMEKAIKDGYDSGIVFVAASGNEETSEFTSPSDFKEVISVNASNKYNQPAYFSNYGILKDITAPGVSIYSTIPGDTYDLMSGTSMASPVAAGIAALILDANPNLSPDEVYNILCASAKKINFKYKEDIFDDNLAYGIINAESAVIAAKQASEDIEISDLSVKPSSISLFEGDTFTFESLVTPATSLKKVVWSSENSAIAQVNPKTGEVTANSNGTTKIFATIGAKQASVSVNVKETVKPTSVTIINKTEYMLKGRKEKLQVGILPQNVSNSDVIFTSSNEKVAIIDEFGTINTIGTGTTTIKVETYDGRCSDTMDITVTKPADKIVYSAGGYTTKLLKGDTFDYKATIVDEDGNALPIKNKLVWLSTNTEVATIDPNTGKLQAIAPGTTYIKVTASEIDQNATAFDKTMKLTVGKENYYGYDYGLKVYSKNYNSVTLEWKKIPVASSYIIERSESLNGPYKKIATVSSSYTRYKNQNLSIGKAYFYRIKATYTTTKSFGYSTSVKASIIPNTPNISSIYRYSSKTLKISWTKSPLATGYYLYRSNSYNGPYYLVKITNTNSYINKNLTKNKKYYYKVRAYKTVGNKKVYSKYSTVKSQIVK